jgi:hypothetical protein
MYSREYASGLLNVCGRIVTYRDRSNERAQASSSLGSSNGGAAPRQRREPCPTAHRQRSDRSAPRAGPAPSPALAARPATPLSTDSVTHPAPAAPPAPTAPREARRRRTPTEPRSVPHPKANLAHRRPHLGPCAPRARDRRQRVPPAPIVRAIEPAASHLPGKNSGKKKRSAFSRERFLGVGG